MTPQGMGKHEPKRNGRPGQPRKSEVLTRITLRVAGSIYDAMNDWCSSRSITQREFLERALEEELQRPLEAQNPKRGEQVSRTGVWIDPGLVAQMDARIEAEGVSQRAFIERAVAHKLKST